jgi:hypothetical protein
MLKFSEVFKNKTFLLAFLIIAFLAVGGLVIFNKTKAQSDCSSYTNQIDCYDAGCWWDTKTKTCKEPSTPTPTKTPTSTPTPTPTGCASYTNQEDCLDAICDWDTKTGTCKELPTSTCPTSQETYSNEGANWSYNSGCYNASSKTSTNLNKKFVPPTSYVHLYSSSLPSMTLSNCSGSQMKTQACFVPTPNNGGFVPYFVKQASSYTFNNVCSSCTMSGAIQSSGGINRAYMNNVSCGSRSTAPVINLYQTTETSASAQYQHSVSVTSGSWTGYSNLSGKITQIDFSADKSKLSKLGDPVTLTFKVVNAPTTATGGGGGGTGRTRQTYTGGNTIEDFLNWYYNTGGQFYFNDSNNTLSILNKSFKNSFNAIKDLFAHFSVFGDSQRALALESYNNQTDCLAHGCDWIPTGYYNDWTQSYYTCVCPGNISISTPVPAPSSQALLALYIGNATCKPQGDDPSCPFHPNSWYVILPPQGSKAKAPTAFLELPNPGYSIKNIFHQLFGFLLPNSQAADITTFSDTWGPVSLTVYPQSATNFYLAVWGLTGDGVGYLLSDPVQVDFAATVNPFVDLKVQKSPGHEFTDDLVWINSGDDVVLKWTSNDVNSCSATSTPPNSQWSNSVPTQGEVTIGNITASTTFLIICQGVNGKQVQDSVQVSIGKPPTKWVDLVGPSTVQQGSPVTLTWTSSGVKSCVASSTPANSYWTGTKPTNGTTTIPSLNQTTTFSINCDNGVATDSITVTAVPQVATINVKVLLDGKEWTGPVSYQLSGPTPITGNAPQSFNVQITNSKGDLYTLIYSSGGPKDAAFVGQETQSVVVKPGDNVTLTLPFSTQHLCQIYVKAFNQDTEWNGNLSYILIGPTVLTANNVPYTFSAVPPGVYYISYISGGPAANFVGVKEGNALTCPSDGSIDFSLLFGTAPSPTPILPPQEVGNNPPTAKIGCVADDPVNCVGTIDGDPNTPTITLYNASTDPDRDIRVCQWTVSGPQQLSKTDCSPVLIFDREGTYTIQLTVIDSLNHKNSTTITAIVQSVKTLTPKFVWDPQVPVVQKETYFYDRSLTPTGTTLKTWSWTFEDGNPATSTEPNPVVIFNSTGQKNVTLQVKNSAGETKTINQLIDVRPAAPQWKEVIPK